MSFAVPIALLAPPTATSRVRVFRSPGSAPRSSTPVAGSKSIQRTDMPTSAATASQGATLASWHSRESTSSSPARQSRASAREMPSVSVVMFCPNAISPGSPPSKSAIAACAASLSASVSTDVRNTPPLFAVPPSRCATMRAIAGAHTCVPPGPSR